MYLIQRVAETRGGTVGVQTARTLLAAKRFVLGNQDGIFRRVGKIAKSDDYLRHACPSVCPHRKTQLALDGFS